MYVCGPRPCGVYKKCTAATCGVYKLGDGPWGGPAAVDGLSEGSTPYAVMSWLAVAVCNDESFSWRIEMNQCARIQMYVQLAIV